MIRVTAHLQQAMKRQSDRDAWFDHDRAYPDADAEREDLEPEDYEAEGQEGEDDEFQD